MEEKNKKDKLIDKMNKVKSENVKYLSNSVATFWIGTKAVGHMVKQLPMAISKKSQAKKNGEANPEIFDYIEDPEFDWNEETKKISGKVEKFFEKLEEIPKKFNPIYRIKKIYEKISGSIRDKNIKKLPSGQEVEKQSEENVEGKRTKFVEELSKGVPTLEMQKKDSVKLLDNKIKGNDVVQDRAE